jgi:hypothetical protein
MIERLDLFQGRSYIVYEPALPILPNDVNLAASLTGLQTGYKMYSRETGKLKAERPSYPFGEADLAFAV